MTTRDEIFAQAERVADAVLYEGYVLYPYRASSPKNQFRWQFGVVAPQSVHDDGEPSSARTECVVDSAGFSEPARLSIRLRCLRPKIDGRSERRWLEGVPVAIDLDAIALDTLPLEQVQPIDVDGVQVRFVIRAEAVDGFIRLGILLENVDPWRSAFDGDRDAMLEHSLVGAHLLLLVESAAFVSMLEPPDDAAAAVAACRNRHTWPVLIGDRSRRGLMLSSPIVLYDYPAVAKESQGDLCDAAEIDEILSLRILTMTDGEKREARATDPRAAAILDRVEAMSSADLDALHGTMRSADFFNPPGTPAPEDAFVMVGDVRVARGSHVRLRPVRRADAMDMFLRDQAATVAGVYRDVDDRTYVAVTVDCDPAATMHDSFGRYFYFGADEIEVERSAEASRSNEASPHTEQEQA
jgi:hypothetical protein